MYYTNFNIIISIVSILIIVTFLIIEKYKKKEFKKFNVDEFAEKHYKKILIIFLILIFISRIYAFGELPKAIGVDEAGAAYDAYNIANFGVDRYLNSFPIYLINFGGGQSALYAYLNVVLIKILGLNNILISRLPELILFIVAIFAGYKLVEKMHNKKTAILFAFMIIITPWHIINSRIGLDCNLFGPMFIITLYLMQNARKNYQYILAGISFGITLYTYAISYIVMPVFLFIWILYNLYFKKITIKQTIIFVVTILIFAIPLMYFVLLNLGLFHKTDFGIFTIPKFEGFRSNELRFSNIWKYGYSSMYTIFLSADTLYSIQIIFFIIGIIKGIKDTINTLKKEEFSFLTLMTLVFLSILLPNLMISVAATTRVNQIYIPILYFCTIGILEVIKNKRIYWILMISVFLLLTILFEVYYYSNYAYKEYTACYDITINEAVDYINENNIKKEKIYLFPDNKEQPYIYVALKNEISPYDFIGNYQEQNEEGLFFRVGNIYCLDTEGMEQYHNDRTYIINKCYPKINSILKNLGYEKVELEEYNIYYAK